MNPGAVRADHWLIRTVVGVGVVLSVLPPRGENRVGLFLQEDRGRPTHHFRPATECKLPLLRCHRPSGHATRTLLNISAGRAFDSVLLNNDHPGRYAGGSNR